MSVDMGSATGYLDLDISGFLAGLQTAQTEAIAKTQNMQKSMTNSMSNIGRGLQSAGTILTTAFTLPIAAAGVAAYKLSSDFETAMTKVYTIADETTLSMSEMSDEIIDLSNETGQSASSLAEAAYEAISSGIKTADAVSFVSQATKLATAGFTDAATSVDVLTTIMNSYGYSIEDVSHISDVLIKTQNLGKVTVDELGKYMGKVIPIANAYQVSLEDLSTSYSYMTASGINAAESTTMLKALMNELAKSSTTVSQVLKEKTGKSFQDLMNSGLSLRDVLAILQQYADDTGTKFNDLWQSQEAQVAALSLLNIGTDEYNQTLEEFISTSGDADEAFKKMQETTEYKWKVAIENAKNALIEFGDVLKEMLLPFLEKAIVLLQNFNKWLQGLSDGQKKMLVYIAAFLAILGPVMIIVGKLLQFGASLVIVWGQVGPVFAGLASKIGLMFTNFAEAMVISKAGFAGLAAQGSILFRLFTVLTGPIGLVIAGVLTLISVFKHLWKTNEDFRESIKEIWGNIVSSFKEFTQGIVDRLNDLGFKFEDITDVIKAIWDGFCNFFAPVFEAAFGIIASILDATFGVLIGLLDVFIGLFTGDWDQFLLGIKEIFGSYLDLIKGVFTSAVEGIIGILDWFCGLFGTSWENVWTGVKETFEPVIDFIVEKAQSLYDFFNEKIMPIITSIKDAFVESFGNIKDSLSEAWDSIIEAFDSVKQAWEDLKENLNETGALDQLKEAWDKLVAFFNDVLIPLFSENLKPAFDAFVIIVQTVASIVGASISVLVSLFSGLLTAVISSIDGMVQALSGVIQTFTGIFQIIIGLITFNGDLVKQGFNNIKQGIVNVFAGLWGAISGFVQGFVDGVINAVTSLVGNFISKISELPGKAASKFNEVKTSIIDALADLPGKMLSIGKDIVQGIIDGVAAKAGALIAKMQSLASSALGAAKKALGINSPSKVFANIVGKAIPEGIGKGIVDNARLAISAVNKVSSSIIDEAKSLMSDTFSQLIDASKITSSYGMSIEEIGKNNDLNETKDKDEKKTNEEGSDTFIFYSPNPIDEREAARLLKKTKRDIAEEF